MRPPDLCAGGKSRLRSGKSATTKLWGIVATNGGQAYSGENIAENLYLDILEHQFIGRSCYVAKQHSNYRSCCPRFVSVEAGTGIHGTPIVSPPPLLVVDNDLPCATKCLHQ
jgi:hypothetical protein